MKKVQNSKLKSQNHNVKLKTLVFLIFMLSVVSCQLSASYAETLSSEHLIKNAKSLDGKSITYKGEVVTAILNRVEYSWVNLNDGDNAIGVWCKSSQLAPIKFIGDYKNRGDMLEVEGKFNRACPMHGGELDIHADSVKIVNSGFSLKERISQRKLTLSTALFLITLSIVVIFRKRI